MVFYIPVRKINVQKCTIYWQSKVFITKVLTTKYFLFCLSVTALILEIFHRRFPVILEEKIRLQTWRQSYFWMYNIQFSYFDIRRTWNFAGSFTADMRHDIIAGFAKPAKLCSIKIRGPASPDIRPRFLTSQLTERDFLKGWKFFKMDVEQFLRSEGYAEPTGLRTTAHQDSSYDSSLAHSKLIFDFFAWFKQGTIMTVLQS